MLPSDYPTDQGSPGGTRGEIRNPYAAAWQRRWLKVRAGDSVDRERGSKGCLPKKRREGQSMVSPTSGRRLRGRKREQDATNRGGGCEMTSGPCGRGPLVLSGRPTKSTTV